MLGVMIVAGMVLVVAAAVVVRRGSGASGQRWPQWLQWAALAAAVVAAVALGPAAADDAGWFATVLLGVPVVLAAIPPVWDLTAGRVGGLVGWTAAVLAIGWALVLALGIGLAFLPAAFLMLAAAASRSGSADVRVPSA